MHSWWIPKIQKNSVSATFTPNQCFTGCRWAIQLAKITMFYIWFHHSVVHFKAPRCINNQNVKLISRYCLSRGDCEGVVFGHLWCQNAFWTHQALKPQCSGIGRSQNSSFSPEMIHLCLFKAATRSRLLNKFQNLLCLGGSAKLVE